VRRRRGRSDDDFVKKSLVGRLVEEEQAKAANEVDAGRGRDVA